MSNDLSVPSAADTLAILEQGTESKYATPAAESEVTKVGDYLPYVSIMSGNSKEVKRGNFKNVGHFALVKNKQYIDLGKQVILYLISWRPKAMNFQPPQAWYNKDSEAFKKIVDICDSGAKNTGKGYGPEFLIWLPEHNELCQWFFGNPTCRNASSDFLTCVKSGIRKCKADCVLIETPKFTWHGPKFVPYDLEITNFPASSALSKQLDKFRNPPETEMEPAEDDDERG